MADKKTEEYVDITEKSYSNKDVSENQENSGLENNENNSEDNNNNNNSKKVVTEKTVVTKINKRKIKVSNPSIQKTKKSQVAKKSKMNSSSKKKSAQKEDQELKEDRFSTIVSIVVFLILILGIIVVVIIFNKKDVTEYEYNSFNFVKVGDSWQTLVVQQTMEGGVLTNRDVILTMYYDPKSLENVEVEGSIVIARSKMIYLSFSPNLTGDEAIAGVEVGKIVGTKNGLLGIPTQTAVYETYNGTYPYATCENVNQPAGVIEFRIGNETKVVSDGNCVVLQGTDSREIIKAADRLAYSLLGIMS